MSTVVVRYTSTVRPTAGDAELRSIPDEDFTLTWTSGSFDRFQADVIQECRDHGWSGAHVLSGGQGPVYDAEGREENYCGWIDAR